MGMTSLVSGLVLLLLICMIAGRLSSFAILPVACLAWFSSVTLSTATLPWTWQTWITLGWASFVPILTGMLCGIGYATWCVRHNMKTSTPLVKCVFEEDSPKREHRIPDWAGSLFWALTSSAILLICELLQASNAAFIHTNLSSDNLILSSLASPEKSVVLTILATVSGYLLTITAASNAIGVILSALSVLVMPALVSSLYALLTLTDSVHGDLSALITCSPVLGVLGTVAFLGGITVSFTKATYQAKYEEANVDMPVIDGFR